MLNNTSALHQKTPQSPLTTMVTLAMRCLRFDSRSAEVALTVF